MCEKTVIDVRDIVYIAGRCFISMVINTLQEAIQIFGIISDIYIKLLNIFKTGNILDTNDSIFGCHPTKYLLLLLQFIERYHLYY